MDCHFQQFSRGPTSRAYKHIFDSAELATPLAESEFAGQRRSTIALSRFRIEGAKTTN
jgi:hypothetical protein